MEYDDFITELKKSPCARLYANSNLVLGRGNHKSPLIAFIGEAPGAREDELRKPFVGRSGQLLDEWIRFLGITKDDFYITNVVKSRPPNNRDPTKEEVSVCAPYLRRELKIVSPKVIVAVGRFAMRFLMPNKKSIIKESGKLHPPNFYVIPHPSYFLRRGGTGWEEYLVTLREHLMTDKEHPQKSIRSFF